MSRGETSPWSPSLTFHRGWLPSAFIPRPPAPAIGIRVWGRGGEAGGGADSVQPAQLCMACVNWPCPGPSAGVPPALPDPAEAPLDGQALGSPSFSEVDCGGGVGHPYITGARWPLNPVRPSADTDMADNAPGSLTQALTFSPLGPSLPGLPLVQGLPLRPCKKTVL